MHDPGLGARCLSHPTLLPPSKQTPAPSLFSCAVTRVESGGYVLVQLNVLTKDMDMFGYADGSNKAVGMKQLF